MNISTIDTDEYYPVCYKVNDAKTLKNLVYYFMLANRHLYYRLARLKLELLIFSGVFYQVSLKGHHTIYMCWILLIFKGLTSYIKRINQSGLPKRTSTDMELRSYPKT